MTPPAWFIIGITLPGTRHKDYKEVYCDIFDLQQAGLAIWYDRGIPAGKNWKDIAFKYITPFSCLGVIFYISENALLSNAIKEEVEFAKTTNKPFLTIFIPSKKGEDLWCLLDRLLHENKIDDERYNFYLSAFPKEVICVSYEEDGNSKAYRIKNALPEQPSLKLNTLTSSYNSDHSFNIYIKGPNDHYAKRIVLNDYLEAVQNQALIDHYNKICTEEPVTTSIFDNLSIECIGRFEIESAAFSNMQNLAYIEIPPIYAKIGEYAFYRCENLSEVRILETEGLRSIDIGEYAFAGCISLKHFNFKGVILQKGAFAGSGLVEADLSKAMDNEIKEEMFYGSELQSVKFPPLTSAIGECAFAFTKLKKIELPILLIAIGAGAFNNCEQLEEIVFNENLQTIGDNAFLMCTSLKEVHLPSSLEEIGCEAFSGCDSLVRIIFDGDSGLLENIADEEWLGYHAQDIEIVCKDRTYIAKKVDNPSSYGGSDWL